MADQVPKRSRLRRRPAAEHDVNHVVDSTPIVSEHVSVPTPQQQEPSTSRENDVTDHQRESHLAEGDAPDPLNRNSSARTSPRATLPPHDDVPSPRLQEERRGSGQSSNSHNNNHDGEESVSNERRNNEEQQTNEEDRLVPNEEPKSSRKRGGFHFRRNRKGREELPTEEEPLPTNSPGKIDGSTNRGVKPMPRYLQYSMFDCLLRSNLFCGLGYNVNKFDRYGRFDDANPGLRLEADADGLSLGITVIRLNSYGVHLVGIVKPLVKVHLVSVSISVAATFPLLLQ